MFVGTKNLAKMPQFLAFHLPQFHPIPENDRWWGKGFTEWSNVTKAKPLFQEHWQPHLPTDLGFYDLRLRDSQRAQTELALQYGISAFCYHYYWFDGTRILEQPLNGILADKDNPMPFCLSWANENWTRAWDASEHEVLIGQNYAAHDAEQFVGDLLPYFEDPRYFRVNGDILFLIYRPQEIPDIMNRIDVWRTLLQKNGISAHLCAALTHGIKSVTHMGFDSAVEFPPHNLKKQTVPNLCKTNREFAIPNFTGSIHDFCDVAEAYLALEHADPVVYPTTFPCWDNTARRGSRATIMWGESPENFEHWLKLATQKSLANNPPGQQLVFINAWNEWAEGCHLEPDHKYGTTFLEAVRRVQEGRSSGTAFKRRVLEQSNIREIKVMDTAHTLLRKIPRELRRARNKLAARHLSNKNRVASREPNPYDGALRVAEPASAPNLQSNMDYTYEIDLDGDTAGSFVLSFIEPGQRVLEIGAGSGAIAKHIVGAKQCELSAIEIVEASIEKLRRYTRDIEKLDLNDPTWADTYAARDKFDVVLAADVLEHVYDPWSVLAGMKRVMAENGSIILSLPHIAHAAVLGTMASADFRYGDWGLLDKTHMRFFCVRNVEALAASSNLKIVDAKAVRKPPETTEFADLWTKLPKDLQQAFEASPYSDIYQFVVKLKSPTAAQPSLDLVTVLARANQNN
jgi:2-polyprenyl-3-methyl-5-hydroxy-6-metoxy-1,4-benzoquinol methylase